MARSFLPSYPRLSRTILSSIKPHQSKTNCINNELYCSFSSKASSLLSSSTSLFSLPQAFQLLLSLSSSALYLHTVNLSVNLNLDPRKPNQSSRGVSVLPHGTGVLIRVAVFAKSNSKAAEEAKAAGADIVGELDLVDQIQQGNINFDRVLSTPDCMGTVGRVARILGPRGLMPNPKLGTVTNDMTAAVANIKAGQVEYKTDKQGIIHVPIGKINFTVPALIDNLTALINTVHHNKPPGAKGVLIKSAFISTSNSPSVQLDISNPPFKTVRSIFKPNDSSSNNNRNTGAAVPSAPPSSSSSSPSLTPQPLVAE
jgi:large subunit ribosomal protein L1